MKRTFVSLLAVFSVATTFAATPAPSSSPALTTDDQKMLYTLGRVLGRNMAPVGVSSAELKYVISGLRDEVNKVPSPVDLETYGPKINMRAKAKMALKADSEKKKAKTFLAAAAKEPGAVKLASGLIYTEITAGTGASPSLADTVKAHYEGKLVDGTVFDSSYKRGQPTEFPLGGVVPCWQEGLQKMKVGGKAKLVCPSEIAYGDAGSPPVIPGGATLIFTVELIDVTKK